MKACAWLVVVQLGGLEPPTSCSLKSPRHDPNDAEPPYRNGTQRNIQPLQLPQVKLLPAERLLKAASNPRDENMSDWLHNLPVGGMALIVFGVTYLVAAVIYGPVMALAGGERARSFKVISPRMPPPLGIVFRLF